ncbi:hypothetical protein MRS44_018235 [Fusarium solani]|uniref:uncharacterized protein n=1 Tax=Fusarium solani TaxID=169388 RepID=UPI0032C40DAD|nr:hypothetical protein MRS44_018235 [Fusarium solani]
MIIDMVTSFGPCFLQIVDAADLDHPDAKAAPESIIAIAVFLSLAMLEALVSLPVIFAAKVSLTVEERTTPWLCMSLQMFPKSAYCTGGANISSNVPSA